MNQVHIMLKPNGFRAFLWQNRLKSVFALVCAARHKWYDGVQKTRKWLRINPGITVVGQGRHRSRDPVGIRDGSPVRGASFNTQ
jgi:hypothetical protein